jgi:hypothetical protein
MNQNTQNGDRYIFKAILCALWVVISALLSVIWFIFAFFVNVIARGIFDNRYHVYHGSRLSYEAPWKSSRRERASGQQNAEYKNLRLENERTKREILMEQKRRLGI